jgi:hypothetical protein
VIKAVSPGSEPSAGIQGEAPVVRKEITLADLNSGAIQGLRIRRSPRAPAQAISQQVK